MKFDKSYFQPLQEEAPPGKDAEEFIKSNKGDFKERYGSRWEEVLYAAAWKKYGTAKKESVIRDNPDPDAEMLEMRDASTMIKEAPLNLGKIDYPSNKDVIAIQRKLRADAPEILKQYQKLVKRLKASAATSLSSKEIVYIRTQPNKEYQKRTGMGDEHQIHMRPIQGNKKSPLGKEVIYHQGSNETVYNTVLAIKEDYISEAAKAKEIKAILKKFPAEAKRVRGGDSLSDKKNVRLYSALDDYFHKKEPQGMRAAGDVYNYLEDAIDDVYAGDFKESFNKSFVKEGTWEIPDNTAKIKKLEKLMKKPLPVGVNDYNDPAGSKNSAESLVSSLIGDDEILDDLEDLRRKKGPKADARPIIKKWLKKNDAAGWGNLPTNVVKIWDKLAEATKQAKFAQGNRPGDASDPYTVKYSYTKTGRIMVATLASKKDAQTFLKNVKGLGMNGIIVKGAATKEEVEEATTSVGQGKVPVYVEDPRKGKTAWQVIGYTSKQATSIGAVKVSKDVYPGRKARAEKTAFNKELYPSGVGWKVIHSSYAHPSNLVSINEAIMVNFNTGVHSAQERWGRVHLNDLVTKFKKAKVKHQTDKAYYVAFDVKSYNDSPLADKMSIGELIADIQKNNGEIDFSERDSMGRIKRMESVEESGMYVKGKGLIDPKGKYAKKAPTEIERERKLPTGPAGSRSPVFKKAVKTYGKGDKDVKALEVLYKKRDALLKKKGDTDRIDKHIGSVEVHFTNSMNESTKDRSWKSYLSSTTNNNPTINEVYMVNTQKQKDGSFKWILQSVEHKKTTVLDTGTESSRAKADRAGKNAKKKLKETATDEENHLTKKFSHGNLPINNKDEETETKEPTYRTKYTNGRKSIVKKEEMIREYTANLKEAVDKDTVNELVLYITNDGQLYRQRTQPIIKNLSKKVGNATYDGLKAIKLFMYLVKDGIKKYEKEFATPGWGKSISKETKQKIATELLDYYTAEIGESYEKV